MALTQITNAVGLSNGFVGPIVDGNGNLYAILEDSGGRLNAFKSTDGGANWSQIDTANRPTAAAAIHSSYSIRQDGTVIHIVSVSGSYTSGMDNVVDVEYHTFNTSDAGANPDTWQTTNELIQAPVHDGGVVTACDLAIRSDGDIIAVHQIASNKDMGTDYRQVGYSRREGGSWTNNNALGTTASNQDYAACVMAPNDECHIFWGDGSNIQARTLDSANNLSTAITAFAGATFAVMAKPIHLTDSGDKIVAARHTSGIQVAARRFEEDGSGDIALETGESTTTVNDSAIGSFITFGLAWDATNGEAVIIWETSDGDIWTDKSANGTSAGWGTDEELEAVTGTGVTRISANGYTRSGQKIGYLVRDGTDWYFGETTPSGGAQTISPTGAIASGDLTGALTTQFIDGPPLITNFCDHISAFNHLRPNGMVFAVGTEIHAVGVDWDSGNSRYRPTIAYSTDDGDTWTKVNATVTDSYVIVGVDYDPDNNRIHIITVDQGPTSNFYYFAYNPATKAFTVTEEAITTTTAAFVAAVQGRSDGTTVALLADGGSPNAYELWIRSSGGTWSGPTTISADAGVDTMNDPAIARGTSDRRHLIWYNSTDNDWKHRTLKSDDTFGTEQAVITAGSQSLTMQAAHANADNEVGIVYAKTDEVWEVIRATSADTPTWGGEETVGDGAVPIQASGNSYMLPYAQTPAGQWVFGLQYGGDLSILFDKDSGGFGTDVDTGVDARYPWDNDTGTVSRGSFIVREGTDGNIYLGWLESVADTTGDGFSAYQEVLLSQALQLAGAVSPTGATIRAAAAAYAGATTPAGAPTLTARLASLAGTLTSSGLLSNIKLITLAIAGVLSSAGALARATAALYAGSLTSAGDTLKQPQQAHDGTLSSSGATLKAAGLTQDGTVSPTGAYGPSTAGKALTGSLTSAGALLRAVQAALAGVLTSAGALTRSTLKQLAGTLTSSGFSDHVIPLIQIAIGGTLTTAGALTRSTAKLLTGSSGSTGSITAAISKTLTGATSPTGALTNIKTLLLAVAGSLTSAGATTLTAAKTVAGALTSSGTVATIRSAVVTVAGSLTSTGALTRSTAKTVAGVITSSGTVVNVKKLLLAVAGVLTSSGSLTRTTGKAIAGVLTSAGVLARSTLHTVTGAITSAGAHTANVGKLLAGAISPTGTVDSIVKIVVNVAGALTSAGAVTKSATQTLTGALTDAGAVTLTAAKTLTGSISSSGTLTNVKKLLLAVAGTLTSSGTVTKAVTKTVTGAISPAGQLLSKALINLGGVLTSAGSLTNQVPTGTEQITVTGTLTSLGDLLIKAGKALDGATTPTGTAVKQSSVTHTAATTPAGQHTLSALKALAGAVTPSGALSNAANFTVALTGAITGLSGALLRKAAARYTGTATSSGTTVKAISHTLTSTLTSSGNLAKKAAIVAQGALTLAGAVATQIFNVLAGPITKLVRGQGNAQGRIRSQGRTSRGIRNQGGTGRDIE